MTEKLTGSELLLYTLLQDVKEGINEDNLERMVKQILEGDTAIAKLIDVKVKNCMHPYETEDDALFYFSSQAALQLVKMIAQGYFGGYSKVSTFTYEEEMNQLVAIANDELCWIVGERIQQREIGAAKQKK